MTQLEAAQVGQVTRAMEQVAAREKVRVEDLMAEVAAGRVVIPVNKNHHKLQPCGIGRGLRTKVNANLGTSTDYPDIAAELEKLQVALDAGADAVMDLSTGGDINECRRQVIARSPAAVGTVPIYQATVEAQEKYGALVKMTVDDLFRVIEMQAEDGVDFITVHCGVTMEVVERLRREGRLADIVSRGGSFLTGWMLHNEQENPLYAHYDRLLEIARRYDVTLSLGDGLRPGCLADATDRAQIQELIILGELVDRAREAGVQAMVEGPGHVPLNQIQANILLEKRLCHEAPFYVLGPLVTDVAPGYDHLTAAIGGALAAAAGADFICYVTPAEHLGLPTLADVREGVIAARIAGHAADLAKGLPGAWEWDREMARARKALDWQRQIELALDPEKARQYRRARNDEGAVACSMCGDFCAMRLVGEYLGKPSETC
ncbi:5-hydroxybenzimidazole synthase BzaA [Moorella thermoacetica]|uniref:Phosphomethylpyrimidine synthase n=2 Tax=Neomoorella thermoacetica TaxID=1525 RepID=A0AAC9HHV1_NEOTH|nr:phosphomethylpyrimidine synthase ThiC [Moorella thermoacetica]AOQ24128.1 Phosphomethylpyrimidine synthase [Moorella thermoacetica]OIQ61373.1 phosphomethylpyrimidine synthase [Moorella thermoacetica]TYL14534.1 5-hydroxybenzimidazole synthase BzaA [Moorella thermoacetica]